MNEINLPEVTAEFLKENSEISRPKKKGGPYTKSDRAYRREQVCRLHFEYGYSVTKIAKMLGINRSTANADIKASILEFCKSCENTSTNSILYSNLVSLIALKTRLREELDKTVKLSDRLKIEKMLLQVEIKLNHIQLYRTSFGSYYPVAR